MSQLVSADRSVWAKLLEDGIRPKRAADGTLPLDTALSRALESIRCRLHLLPLPHAKKPDKPPKPPKIRLIFGRNQTKARAVAKGNQERVRNCHTES